MKKGKIKKILIGLLVVVVGFSIYTYVRMTSNQTKRDSECLERLQTRLESGESPNAIFNQDLGILQNLVERSLTARSRMLLVSNELKANEDKPISSKNLLILKQGTEDYLNLREKLYRIALAYECALDVEESTLDEYNIDSQLRLKGVMLSIGAALTLYDNYMLGSILFEQDSRLRRIINDPDMGFGLVSDKLEEMTLAASSVENRYRVRRALSFYQENDSLIQNVHEDSDLSYLKVLIESSPSYNYIKQIQVKAVAFTKFVAFERITTDLVQEMTKDGLDLVSGLFGNTMGLYEWRRGKLYGDAEAKENIQDHLQPLDILLEKTPFRLTDKLIPGHFGHVAIWTGTKAELIDMELWEEMYVKEYENKIENSKDEHSKNEHQIIEALRSGVQLSSLDHFMNVDDVAVLRPIFTGDDKEERIKEALLMAFRQLGKEYDFNFDVNTTDKIVCSELAYVSFPTIDWPTEKTLGRHSISPDNVAKLAWNNVPLELILFYHDGELVSSDVQVEKMKELMTN